MHRVGHGDRQLVKLEPDLARRGKLAHGRRQAAAGRIAKHPDRGRIAGRAGSSAHEAVERRVSERSSVPNSRPSLTLITAIPCMPIGPLMITMSPGVARSGRSSIPSDMIPMPAVLMYSPSP